MFVSHCILLTGDKFTETLQFTCNFLIFFLYDNCGMMYKEARQL